MLFSWLFSLIQDCTRGSTRSGFEVDDVFDTELGLVLNWI